MTNRRQYKLNNLDCASCASKIEERLSAIDTFSEVSVNFPTATLTLKAKGEPRELVDRINLEISRVEPGCVAVELSGDRAGSHSEQGRSHTHSEAEGKWQIGTVIASAICFVTAYLCREIPAAPAILSPILFISSILLAGWPVFAAAVKSLRHISLDEHLLVTIAVVAASFMGCLLYTSDAADE